MHNEHPIIGISTDPYGEIYGYSLVFIKLFSHLSSVGVNPTYLLCNDGESYKNFNGRGLFTVKLNREVSMISKLLKLTYFFVRTTWKKFPKESIVIVNCEIPELIAGSILRYKFKNTYCYLQDTRVRSNSIGQILVSLFRKLLILQIGKILFANKYTMQTTTAKLKYLLGDPVFLINKFSGADLLSRRRNSLVNAYFVGLPSIAKGINDFSWLATKFKGRIKFHWLTKNVSPETRKMYPTITFVTGLDDDQLISQIQLMDIFVNCSHFEGFSLPTAEALYLEKVTFSYKLPEIYAAFGDNIHSYVDPFDMVAYRENLEKYLDTNLNSLRMKLKRGKEMVLAQYSPDTICDRLLLYIHNNYEK